MALELERVARSDEFFVKRKLYPNVDFFSGGSSLGLGSEGGRRVGVVYVRACGPLMSSLPSAGSTPMSTSSRVGMGVRRVG